MCIASYTVLQHSSRSSRISSTISVFNSVFICSIDCFIMKSDSVFISSIDCFSVKCESSNNKKKSQNCNPDVSVLITATFFLIAKAVSRRVGRKCCFESLRVGAINFLYLSYGDIDRVLLFGAPLLA
jgi:hypothetical protein